MDGEAGDVLYAAYLSMARAGIASMEMWDPKSSKWGQAASILFIKESSCMSCFAQISTLDLCFEGGLSTEISLGHEAHFQGNANFNLGLALSSSILYLEVFPRRPEGLLQVRLQK